MKYTNTSQQDNNNNETEDNLKCVKYLESGSGFGELSLIYNTPRLASIRNLETIVHLAVLSK